MKIAGINYKVTLFDREDDTGEDGKIQYRKAQIGIIRGNPDYMESTLWHELVHAILTQNGDTELAKDEDFIARTSSMIHQIFKDNPDLYAEIREKE